MVETGQLCDYKLKGRHCHLPDSRNPKFRGSVLDPGWFQDRGDGLLSGRGDLRPIEALSYGFNRLGDGWKLAEREGWPKDRLVGLRDGLLRPMWDGE